MDYIPELVIAFLVLVFWISSVRRSLEEIVDNINNAMIQISTQLSSEWDALNCLLDLTKGYLPSESMPIMETINERRSITKDSCPEEVCEQENIIAKTISDISEAAEEYPDLKADYACQKAMDAVLQYENMVQTSRLIYNNSARKLNRAIRTFPASVIAGILGFTNRDCFEEDQKPAIV